jgi:hypothetical protein
VGHHASFVLLVPDRTTLFYSLGSNKQRWLAAAYFAAMTALGDRLICSHDHILLHLHLLLLHHELV